MFLRILNTAQQNSPLQNISDDILMNKDVFTAGSGQREPPRLVLEVGGTSIFQAWLPAKLKSPPTLKHKSGGSRWPDPAVLGVAKHLLNFGSI